eukprot:scaffold6967_cov123-Isochrysis_galbana.AAC.7
MPAGSIAAGRQRNRAGGACVVRRAHMYTGVNTVVQMADVGSRCRVAAWWKPDAECMDVVVEYTTCPRHNASSNKITRSKPLWFLTFGCMTAVLLLCCLPVSPQPPVVAAFAATSPPLLLPSPSRTTILRPASVVTGPIPLVLSSALLLLTSMPGSLGWLLALAFLPAASAAPQPWYYALHVPR